MASGRVSTTGWPKRRTIHVRSSRRHWRMWCRTRLRQPIGARTCSGPRAPELVPLPTISLRISTLAVMCMVRSTSWRYQGSRAVRWQTPSFLETEEHYRKIMGVGPTLNPRGDTEDQEPIDRKRMARLSGQMSRGHHPVEKAMAPVRDACQSFPPFNAIFPLFRYAAISHRPTASAADRAVLIEFRRFLTVIRATGTPPSGPTLIA